MVRSARRVLLAALLPACAIAQAPTNPSVIPEAPFPGDRIGVPLLSAGVCQMATLDAAMPPRIRETGSPDDPIREYQLDYYLRESDVVCIVAPPQGVAYHADIGPLDEGSHIVYVTLWLDGAELQTYVTQPFIVAVGSEPGRDISGLWWSPTQSGRGVSVTRMRDTTAIYWATHDADGAPHWVTLIQPSAYSLVIEGEAISTQGAPLSAEPATLDVEDWGTLRFEYQRCGRARLAWDARDPAIGDGALDLVQAGVPLGVPPCDIGTLPNVAVAEWLDPA